MKTYDCTYNPVDDGYNPCAEAGYNCECCEFWQQVQKQPKKRRINFKALFSRFKRLLFFCSVLLLTYGCSAEIRYKTPLIEPDFYWSDQMGGGNSWRLTEDSERIVATVCYLCEKIGITQFVYNGIAVSIKDDYIVLNGLICEKYDKLILKIEI